MTTMTASPAHAHEVQFYHDDGFLADGVATFIARGLKRGNAAIVVATFQHWTAIETRLDLHGLDVGQLIEDGQLTYADASQTLGLFMLDGLPDPIKFENSVGALVRSKIAAYPALCAYGEMVDLLSGAGNHTGTLALEELWNHLLAGHPAHLLCGYRLDRFNRESHRECFRHICHAHSHVLPTEDFTQIGEGEAQRRAIAELQQQAIALRSEVEGRRMAEDALKRKADALERSNEELQRFAYVAAHDLQEPLRMVTQYMDLVRIRGAESLSQEISRYIGHAVAGATRMRELIDALLAYGHAGHADMSREAVDINSVLADVRVALSTALTESGAHLSYAELPTIMGDLTKLTQVFHNLVENAVKYRSTAPLQISVSAVRENASWIFSVRDNGMGIVASHHQKIFDVFHRLHRHETIPGTGIGLAICKRIIEQHAGTIWLESSPGLGSTFRFRLPA